MNNSYIIVVTDMERQTTQFLAVWEPELPEHENSDIELYRHAQPHLAQMVNAIGHDRIIAHIELTCSCT